MLTRLNNKNGIISYNKSVVEQIINEALRPYKGQAWLANYKGSSCDWLIAIENYDALAEKEIRMGEHGVIVRVYLIIKIGSSISEICRHMVKSISDDIINQLQLPVENVEVIVSGVVSKRASKREIRYDYQSMKDEF